MFKFCLIFLCLAISFGNGSIDLDKIGFKQNGAKETVYNQKFSKKLSKLSLFSDLKHYIQFQGPEQSEKKTGFDEGHQLLRAMIVSTNSGLFEAQWT